MSRPRRENYSRKSYDPRRAFGSANYLNTVTGGGRTIPAHIKSLWRTAGGTLRTLRGPAHATSYTGAFTMEDGSSKSVPVDSTKGLWVGPGYTNSIPNSQAVGAVAGTPGTLPTGWRKLDNGAVWSVVGVGDGFVDVRISGTSTNAVAIYVTPGTFVAASTGQVWNASARIQVISGSYTGFKLRLSERLGEGATSVSLDSEDKTYEATRTLSDVGTTGIDLYLVNDNVGVVHDTVFRISRPQITQTAYKMPYIPTTGSTVTNPSAVGTSGGNGASWPLTGSDSAERLIECFRGVPDGVELATNGQFLSDISGWSTSGTWAWNPGGGVKHTPGTSNSLYRDIGLLGVTYVDRYKAVLAVSMRTAGTVTLRLGQNSNILTVSANGEYSNEQMFVTDKIAWIIPSIDFNGVVTLSIQKLSPAIFTVGALCYMGVRSAELPSSNYAILDSSNTGLLLNHSSTALVKSYDGVNNPSYAGSWSRDEIHLKLVQSKVDGSQFRIGNKRIGIDSSIQWGSWANFDGSFNPLTALRLAYTGVIPLHIKGAFVSNKSMSDAEIERQYNLIAV